MVKNQLLLNVSKIKNKLLLAQRVLARSSLLHRMLSDLRNSNSPKSSTNTQFSKKAVYCVQSVLS